MDYERSVWKQSRQVFLYFNFVFFYIDFENLLLPYIERFSLVVC